MATNPHCPVLVFIDGMPMNVAREKFDFDAIQLTDIEAIEIYRSPAQVPAQYGGANSACGVILLWRRVGVG